MGAKLVTFAYSSSGVLSRGLLPVKSLRPAPARRRLALCAALLMLPLSGAMAQPLAPSPVPAPPAAPMASANSGDLPALPTGRATRPGILLTGEGSGAFAAVQFQMAWPRLTRGVGVQGGGAYNCAGGSLHSAALTCTCPTSAQPSSAPLGLMPATQPHHCLVMPPQIMARRGTDSVRAQKRESHTRQSLRHHRLWWHAAPGSTGSAPAVTEALGPFYAHWGVRPAQRRQWPSDQGFSSAALDDMMRWLSRSPQAKPAGSTHPDRLQAFDQTPYRQAGRFDGLGEQGWVYVPPRCDRQPGACRVQVVFHACEARPPLAGDGLTERQMAWAETLGLVLLYPRVEASVGTAGQRPRHNPMACWDFWGYTQEEQDAGRLEQAPAHLRRDAPQLAAVHRMVQALHAHKARSAP